MKLVFDFVMGFSVCIFAFFGFSGLKNLMANAISKKQKTKRANKIIDQYKKIDSKIDTRSDLDVLRKN